jgi:hypothetical protein
LQQICFHQMFKQFILCGILSIAGVFASPPPASPVSSRAISPVPGIQEGTRFVTVGQICGALSKQHPEVDQDECIAKVTKPAVGLQSQFEEKCGRELSTCSITANSKIDLQTPGLVKIAQAGANWASRVQVVLAVILYLMTGVSAELTDKQKMQIGASIGAVAGFVLLLLCCCCCSSSASMSGAQGSRRSYGGGSGYGSGGYGSGDVEIGCDFGSSGCDGGGGGE